MMEQEFDRFLCGLLLDTAAEDGQAALEACARTAGQYSARYLNWEQKLLADPFGFARREKRPRWKKRLRTVLIAAVVAALLLGGALAATSVFQGKAVRWKKQEETTHTTHRFENPNYGEVGYTHETLPDDVRPGFIPEGYEQAECFSAMGHVSILYENTSDDRLFFDYQTIHEGMSLSVNSEYHKSWTTVHNGMATYVTQSMQPQEHFSYIIWTNEPMNVVFMVSGKVDLDTLFAIMDSVPAEF